MATRTDQGGERRPRRRGVAAVDAVGRGGHEGQGRRIGRGDLRRICPAIDTRGCRRPLPTWQCPRWETWTAGERMGSSCPRANRQARRFAAAAEPFEDRLDEADKPRRRSTTREKGQFLCRSSDRNPRDIDSLQWNPSKKRLLSPLTSSHRHETVDPRACLRSLRLSARERPHHGRAGWWSRRFGNRRIASPKRITRMENARHHVPGVFALQPAICRCASARRNGGSRHQTGRIWAFQTRRFRHCRDRVRPSHQATTTQGDRRYRSGLSEHGTRLMNLSMPRTIAMPGTSRGSTTARVAARVMKPAPVMPDAPLEVSHGDDQDGDLAAQGTDRYPAPARMNNVAKRHVDVGAVEIEGIPRRPQRDRPPVSSNRHARVFSHQRWQRASPTMTCPSHDQQFILDVGDELENRGSRRFSRSPPERPNTNSAAVT